MAHYESTRAWALENDSYECRAIFPDDTSCRNEAVTTIELLGATLAVCALHKKRFSSGMGRKHSTRDSAS